MRKILVLLASVASVSGLASGVGVASADEFTAQACYDNAKPYSKPAGELLVPPGFPGGAWFTTTSNCADINIKANTTRLVRVCFDPSAGAPYCQEAFSSVPAGQWDEVATSVANGTKFKFEFATPAASTGFYAA